MRWLPILGFVALGAFFLQKAVRASAHRSWAWGRTGDGPPLSRKAYAAWASAFLAIAWVIGEAPRPGAPSAAFLLVSFVGVLVAGWVDASAHRR